MTRQNQRDLQPIEWCVFGKEYVTSAPAVVGILDGEIKALDVGQNEVRNRRALNAFPAASAMVGPTCYVLGPLRDSASNGASLFRVGGDLYEDIGWQVFRPGTSRWADRLGIVVEPPRPPSFFHQLYRALPLTQSGCTDDEVRPHDVAASVELSDEVFGRFHARIRVTFP